MEQELNFITTGIVLDLRIIVEKEGKKGYNHFYLERLINSYYFRYLKEEDFVNTHYDPFKT